IAAKRPVIFASSGCDYTHRLGREEDGKQRAKSGLIQRNHFRREDRMKFKADKPQRLLLKSIILLSVAALAPVMGNLMDCKAQSKQRGQSNKPPTQPLDEPGITKAIAEVKEDYRISPGDVIEIQIDRAPELSGVFRVSASGTITMQYLGRITA